MTARRTLVLGAALLSSLARAEDPPAPPLVVEQQLIPADVLERELVAGTVHAYELSLQAGDLVDALLEQRGADLSLAIVAPAGSTLLEVDANDDPQRFERALWIAPEAGRYRLLVRPGPGSAGPYRLTVGEPRSATAAEVQKVAAARRYEEGLRLADSEGDSERDLAPARLEQAAAGFRAGADQRAEAEAVLALGAQQATSGRAAQALESGARALELFGQVGDRAALTAAHRLMGRACEATGDVPGARRHLDEAVRLAGQTGNTQAEAASRNQLGDFLRARGDLEPAIELFERAIALSRRVGDVTTETYALNNLGISYRSLGEYEKALASFEQALPLARGRDPGTEARIALNAGNAHRSLGDYPRALERYERYLGFARGVGSRDDEARALSNQAAVHILLGEHETALEESQRSLELRRAIGRRSGEAQSLRNLAESLDGLGRTDEAVAATEQALRIHRDLRETRSEAEALASLAKMERTRGNLDAALARVQESIRLSESLRSRLTSPAFRTSFVAAAQEKYELLVDLCMRLQARDPAGEHAASAFAASEAARARVLLEALVEARADVRQGIDPALLDEERQSQERLDTASDRLGRLLAARAPAARLASATAEADDLGARHLQLLARIRQASPAYAELMQPSPLSASSIQKELLDPETVLLEFSLGEERSFLFALTSSELLAHALPPRATIEESAREVYASLTARQHGTGPGSTRVRDADERLPAQALALSRMLLGPIAARLHGDWRSKRLAIVAADALAYLPFGALPRPHDGGPALLQEHEIVSLPSASVLAALRRQVAGQRAANPSVVVLADPVFDPNDPRVARAAAQRSLSAAPPAPAGRLAVTRAAESLGRHGFPRLPFSRAEARAIAALAPAGALSQATDFAASRAWISAGHLAGHDIVHFATHGLLNSEHPALSGLLLSLVDEHAAWQDGFLRMPDIYNLRLDAQLVVLSACQTALGRQVRGEGLIGVTRGFMYAGAPRVAASLWQVDDESTAELMRIFYRGLLREQRRPADALRLAQLELSRQKRWAAPYYWAGFVLQGEWR